MRGVAATMIRGQVMTATQSFSRIDLRADQSGIAPRDQLRAATFAMLLSLLTSSR